MRDEIEHVSLFFGRKNKGVNECASGCVEVFRNAKHILLTSFTRLTFLLGDQSPNPWDF